MNNKGAHAAANAMRDIGGFDEQSVTFSVDPDMYTKLDIKKAKLGEENAFDVQKIYNFQLEKDIKKLTTKKGKYKDRNSRFLEIRKLDEDYKRVAVLSSVATHGNFKEILEYTAEESWKATSRPYGEQAHKRYLDYVANIPKGPSEEAVMDKAQRKMDKELWEKIISGRTELTKKELRQKQQEAEDKMEAFLLEQNELDSVRKRRHWKRHIAAEDFEGLRSKPTVREWDNSMNKWSKGVHFPYEMEEKGFPYVTVDTLEGTKLIKAKDMNECMAPEMKFSAEKFIAGNDGADKQYLEHMVGINLAKVDKYLKKRRKDIAREEQMEAELKLIREKQRRRAARVERHNVADAIVTAKYNVIQNKNQKVKKIKAKKPGLLDAEETEQEKIEESDDDDWSDDSDLDFGGGGGDGEKTKAKAGKNDGGGEGGEEKNEDDDDEEDGNIGTGYQRQQGGINVPDIMRLNEQITGGGAKKPATRSPGVRSPKAGAPATADTPARRRAGVLTPLPPLQIGNSGEAGDQPDADEQRGVNDGGEGEEQKSDSGNEDEKAGNARGVTFQNPAESEGDENHQEDRISSGSPKRSAWNKDISSTKYSTKYTQWQFSSTANIPDYIKSIVYNNTSSKNSAKVLPSAYNVKNIKQRNIVLRVVIHYVKKLNPRRLLHLTFRGYRRAKKFYKHHFTNPDGLTPSERDKLATIRKLDLLTQDASTIEYHKSIVNLADHEIPSEEFLKAAKKKRRVFTEQINKLVDKGHLNADEQRQVDMLRRRLELHDEVYNRRLKREQYAKQRAGLIKRYIADSKALVEETSNFTWIDQWRIYIRTMKQDMVQRTVQMKNDKTQEHILPEYERDKNKELIEAMHEARMMDRKQSAWKRKWKRRWRYMLSGSELDLEDEDYRRRDVDDLILAARAGNYVEVMDIVLHPSHPVSPNALNEDGITATYATLMMILKREVLDNEEDIAMLGLSKYERFWKALRKKKGTEPKLDLVLRALLYCGGNADFQKIEAGVDGSAAMHTAAETGALDMIDWLLKKGTDINIRTAIQQKTPLMLALEHNQLEVVDLLLKRGVMMHLQLKDANGWTALHYAACFARVELSVILMTCGAKTTIRNAAGRLPSEEARARGRTEVAAAIMTFRSDVVETRQRIDNLMNRTDAQYRKHRQKLHISQHSNGAQASAPPRGPGGGAGGRNVLRLPPIPQPGELATNSVSESVSLGGTGAPGEQEAVAGGAGTVTGETPADVAVLTGPLGDLLGATAENPEVAKAKEEAAVAAREREAYERRMSSIVAAADPWNLAPHTKPKPNRLAKMSFYSRPKSAK